MKNIEIANGLTFEQGSIRKQKNISDLLVTAKMIEEYDREKEQERLFEEICEEVMADLDQEFENKLVEMYANVTAKMVVKFLQALQDIQDEQPKIDFKNSVDYAGIVAGKIKEAYTPEELEGIILNRIGD